MATAAASLIVVGILSKGTVPAAILGGVAGFQAFTALVHLGTGVYEHIHRNRELAALDRGLRTQEEGRSNYRPDSSHSEYEFRDETAGRFGNLRGGGGGDHERESTASENEYRHAGGDSHSKKRTGSLDSTEDAAYSLLAARRAAAHATATAEQERGDTPLRRSLRAGVRLEAGDFGTGISPPPPADLGHARD